MQHINKTSMNLSTIKGVKIEAIAACVPQNKVDNLKYAQEHFTDDFSATLKALGVMERHVAVKEDTTALTMAIEAAMTIFDDGTIKREDIGAVIMVTLSPDCLMPNNATYAQYLLGLPMDVAAFDINHACPGYVFGLWNAALICQNMQKKVLLLDGDINTKYVSPWDKSTALLFGDAGTATVLTPDTDAKDWHFSFTSDGSNRDAILMRLGFKYPIKLEYLEYNEYPDGSKRRFIDMQMDGKSVFDYVVGTVPEYVQELMDELETEPAEYDKVVLHQANLFMLRKLTKTIGFDSKTQMPICMDKYGNTSSVSVPLTIASEIKEEDFHVMLIGMGAGLATGIGDVYINGLKNFGVKELDL